MSEQETDCATLPMGSATSIVLMKHRATPPERRRALGRDGSNGLALLVGLDEVKDLLSNTGHLDGA